MRTKLLVADVGGTNADLALYLARDGGRWSLEHGACLASADFDDLSSLVLEFLQSYESGCSGVDGSEGRGAILASIAVAGPVDGDRVQLTNLPWPEINAPELASRLGLRGLKLLNDVEAMGYAVQILEAPQYVSLNPKARKRSGHCAVIAPGTGMGQALVLGGPEATRVVASEGGHSSFAPQTLLQAELWGFLKRGMSHISVESLCSGALGIPRIYRFLRERYPEKESGSWREEIEEASDPTPAIVQGGLEHRCEVCRQSLDLFVSILGSHVGNMALHFNALGGIYLGGGIVSRIASRLEQEDFFQSFVAKGRMSSRLSEIPLYAVVEPKLAVYGAQRFALQHFKLASHAVD